MHEGKLKGQKAFCILSVVPTKHRHSDNGNEGLRGRELVLKPPRLSVFVMLLPLLCQPEPVTCPCGILDTRGPC